VLVVAYNAVSTLAQVLDRIPSTFRGRVSRVFVCDDASQDATYLVGLGYKQITDDLPLTVIRHATNLGYGGNQKAGYRLAIQHDLDIVVLLHGDGQYAPECIEEMVAPLERGECDAVLGSRMMHKGAARKGGMPLYKYLGNRILTSFENRMLGTDLSEFHSGYRAYSVKALSELTFETNSDAFDFDTQIIIQLVAAGKRIVEVPIPTYYGDEICYVNGVKYAKDVSAAVLRHRLATLGFTSGDTWRVEQEYPLKDDGESSHAVILRWLETMPPARILDLGCSGGLLSARMRALGHTVVGVDIIEFPEVADRVDQFIKGDLDDGLPREVEACGPFDVVIAADILEHVRAPELILDQSRNVLAASGKLIASVPNFAHWYVRGRTALGLFDYDQRGILDSGHVRFFTRRGLLRMLQAAGYAVVRHQTTGLPLDALTGTDGTLKRAMRMADRLAIGIRPTLFGYQFIYQCEARPVDDVASSDGGYGDEAVGTRREPATVGSAAPHGSRSGGVGVPAGRLLGAL
jgi:2-polyprenyl-3-methyl-5-hydroxy-6-metoxy-1,4-benzoquinol methylase